MSNRYQQHGMEGVERAIRTSCRDCFSHFFWSCGTSDTLLRQQRTRQLFVISIFVIDFHGQPHSSTVDVSHIMFNSSRLKKKRKKKKGRSCGRCYLFSSCRMLSSGHEANMSRVRLPQT